MNRQGAEDAKLPEPDFEIDQIARVVVDAALEVHRILGPGLLESVYEQALGVELGLRGIAFARQVPIRGHIQKRSRSERRGSTFS
jgi:GxxExxY protein